MARKDISPCDCSIIPVSPTEGKQVFPNTEEELREAIDRARDRPGSCALCPGCYRVFPTADLSRS